MRNLNSIYLLSFVLIFTAACQGMGKVELKTDQQKASYAIGRQIGQGMKNQGIEVDPAVLAAGISDSLSGAESKLTDQEMQAAVQNMQKGIMEKRDVAASENKKKGDEFLAKNKSADGVKTTKSGLQYKVVKEGKGKKPGADDRVTVHYRGTLIDGTEFDSSYKRDQPATFPVRGVIKGWTEALQLMPTGSKWKLFIPSELAYGRVGRPNIPANSVLVFDVELLEVADSKKPASKKPAKKK